MVSKRQLQPSSTVCHVAWGSTQVGCFARLGIYEENARFILISLLLVLYLVFGAFLFHYVERENEIEERILDPKTDAFETSYCRKSKILM
ncbi:unnamed protein product [Nippostrongylus brasiliensis]|uniref:Potassium voltage-gated channel subfamily E member 3 n=1 Tax=Nippostrongylus brasiliensis TaxID=27835 RepID=A0A0N4YFG8_NIPBR|nr:unnamed protein product [Nippostrongylus brasiliensis]